MEYVYAAIFEPNDDGSFTISFPDFPGCISEGKSLSDALYMAERVLSQRLEYLSDKREEIPEATEISGIETKNNEFANLIRGYVRDTRAVRRSVSIPKWMDDQVSAAGISLSRILQEALKHRLQE